MANYNSKNILLVGLKGKTAYESAQTGGYTGTEAQFNTNLAAVGNKVDKVTGKGLSTQDYTTKEKRTLANVAELLKGNEYTLETGTSPVYSDTVQTGAQKWAQLGMVGGKTVAMNQLVNVVDKTVTSNGVTFVYSASQHKLTMSGTATGVASASISYSSISGHKYCLFGCRSITGVRNNISDNGDHTDTGSGAIWTSATTETRYAATIVESGTTVSDYVYVNVIDLTQMFGAGNEPATAAEFRAMFPADYYAYDAGSLMSGKCDKVVTKDDDSVQIAEYQIPSAVQSLGGYGWSAGTVYNEVNFSTKKFIKRVGVVDLGTLTWTKTSLYFQTTEISSVIAPPTGGQGTGNYLMLPYTQTSYAERGTDKTYYVVFSGGTGEGNLRVYDSAYTDADAFKTALSGVMLYYELATPVETDISAYITDDVFLETEAGGTVTFHQTDDTRLLLPNTVTYMVKVSDAI